MKLKVYCNSCNSQLAISARHAEGKDLAALKRFLGTALSKGLMDTELAHTRVLEANGRIIASLGAIPLSHNQIYFSTLKVARSFRRKGLAERLMREALADAHEKKFAVGYAVTLTKKPAALVTKLGAGRIPKEEMPRGLPKHLYGTKEHKYQYWAFGLLENSYTPMEAGHEGSING